MLHPQIILTFVTGFFHLRFDRKVFFVFSTSFLGAFATFSCVSCGVFHVKLIVLFSVCFHRTVLILPDNFLFFSLSRVLHINSISCVKFSGSSPLVTFMCFSLQVNLFSILVNALVCLLALEV